MDVQQKRDLVNYLSEFITSNKKDLFARILKERTNYITVVLENIYQSQNASAVLRTCDCFGVQNVHVIENNNRFDVNPDVALGASKWLSVNRHYKQENNTRTAIADLKKEGYRIIATCPHTNDTTLDEFDLLKGKCAFVFGTERTGISDIVEEEADEFVRIPMYGFTESFNISVSAAIMLHHLTSKLRQDNVNWRLTEDEILDLKLSWIRKSIKKAELLEKQYRKSI